MANYYSDPRENPIRNPLCAFLVACGQQDFYQAIHTHSNYYLEILAKHHGYGKRDCNGHASLKAIEECENMVELAKQNPTMLDLQMWEQKLAQLRKVA